jgi:hypothetical protein
MSARTRQRRCGLGHPDLTDVLVPILAVARPARPVATAR